MEDQKGYSFTQTQIIQHLSFIQGPRHCKEFAMKPRESTSAKTRSKSSWEVLVFKLLPLGFELVCFHSVTQKNIFWARDIQNQKGSDFVTICWYESYITLNKEENIHPWLSGWHQVWEAHSQVKSPEGETQLFYSCLKLMSHWFEETQPQGPPQSSPQSWTFTATDCGSGVVALWSHDPNPYKLIMWFEQKKLKNYYIS